MNLRLEVNLEANDLITACELTDLLCDESGCKCMTIIVLLGYPFLLFFLTISSTATHAHCIFVSE